jgi:hypothetical protein
MADKKITALEDLQDGIEGIDLLHVIDMGGSPVNKKVTVANVFNNIPTWIGLDGVPQPIIQTNDPVNLITSITEIDTSSLSTGSASTHTLADGSRGQIKIITMTGHDDDAQVTPTNFANGTSFTFTAVGQTIVLLFTNSNWIVISNYGTTINP